MTAEFGRALPTPTRMKDTRTMELGDAVETWNELLNKGWELVEHQINDDAA